MLPFSNRLNNISEYFEIRGRIGEGTFGIIRKGVHKLTGQFVAVKSNKFGVDKPNAQNEAAILSSMTHPNVMAALATYAAPEQAFIIMPFASGGDLSAYLAAHEDPPQRSVAISLVQQDAIVFIQKRLTLVTGFLTTSPHRDQLGWTNYWAQTRPSCA